MSSTLTSTPAGSLKLDEQLCFPLYACSREITRRYTPLLNQIGLTYTQYIVMLVLWEEGTVTMKSLGERLHLDSGTLTPVLKAMEAKGLISRHRSLDDERTLVISIADKGEELRSSAEGIPQTIGVCINLPPEDAATLYKLLYQVLEGFSQ